MCGIAGFVGCGSEEGLRKIMQCIDHRGHDDEGLFFNGNVGLGHKRLSILDLSQSGHQPMFNNDRNVGIVFNGEIYNFQVLKSELVAKGHTFISHSDTEVILAMYKEYGEKCFEKFIGMFAIGIYDFKNSKLILARDRCGEKPLYWYLHHDLFVFASELGALMFSGLIEKKLSLVSLEKYLLFDFVPTPHTILENVYKLEPATYLIFEQGKVRKNIFWQPTLEIINTSEEDSLAKLDSLLSESVKTQLVADVPIGVFLSGGIDSSTVAWYAKKNSKTQISTFSIGFEDKAVDESNFARKVAEYLDTDHHEMIVTAEDVLSIIEKIPQVFSEPVADASVIPTLLLSKFTKERVKVSLGGDGGDELFVGYPTFQAEQIFGLYDRLPKLVKKINSRIINSLPQGKGEFNIAFNLKKFISSHEVKKNRRHMEWLGSFPKQERERLMKDASISGDIFEDMYELQNNNNNELLYAYMRSYLMDEVLVKVDRASMHYGLEVRAPFLDYRVVDFVLSLPYYMKYKGFNTKILLKKLMIGRLPAEILNRKKKGFGLPLSTWLKCELKDLCNEVLSKEEMLRQGLFNHEYVERLKNDHFEGRANNKKQLWNLMVFSMWYKKWLT